MRQEILPTARALEHDGTRFPAIAAQLGADTYTYVTEWLHRLQTELEGETDD